ncbi:two-component sensor histidine kinase [Actinomycetospora sp. NBRC 106375]|uniref:HAMP domain-containing sensor histidine kinase n=1 Tax=Actinomycetospora sp. NBRC 106375 TaxID=3032207 RepID=UPI0024A5995B|nr:HAMP domain-containing sensor histidine kinase [Actinomycetospora sp. NBRC 106375]GLZ49848.1 two-component sensor histidine kinase [Actinomycetospora sp. NBRC 106375]
MSLRTRLALAFALVAAVVAGLVGVLSYHSAGERISDESDRSLAAATTALIDGQTAVLSALPPTQPTDSDGLDGDEPGGPDPRREGPTLTAQRIAPDGTATYLGGRRVRLPVDDATRGLAASGAAGRTATTEIDLGRGAYRVRTTALGDGRGAVQVAVDIDLSRRVLGGLATEIALISLAVTVVAAGAGWLLARRITRRLVRLATTAEDIADHGRIDVAVPVSGRDEVGRLATSFTTMLARLGAARDAQDRLVQDAAHELRTPLTSLRTNASVLRRLGELSPDARDRLVRDIQGETRELSDLVDELVELALSRRSEEPDEDIGLGDVVRLVAERVQRRSGRAITVDDDGSRIRGQRGALERAVGNLLENAVKFDAGGSGDILARVRAGTTTVTDRGPGIAPADAARVFDRFYRADSARGLPGSGLGLAIVRDVAEGHGGGAFVSTPPGGGTTVGFSVGAGRLLPAERPDGTPSPA